MEIVFKTINMFVDDILYCYYYYSRIDDIIIMYTQLCIMLLSLYFISIIYIHTQSLKLTSPPYDIKRLSISIFPFSTAQCKDVLCYK